MTKSKPHDLPGIKQYFYDFYGRQATNTDARDVALSLQQQAADALMLWVSEEMTLLTSAAKDSLSDDSGNFFPNASGIALFDGGTGIKVPLDYFPETHWIENAFGQRRPPQAEIDGVFWVSTDDRDQVLFFGVSLSPEIPRQDASRKALLVDVSGDKERQLSKFMRAVWLLSSQEGMAEQQDEIVGKGGGKKRAKSLAQKKNNVRIVSLKKHEREYQPSKDAQGKWQLDHQVVVSGHWKNQPYGPRDAGLRRPQFIRPYVKGPDGTKLVVRPTVKVWS